MEKKKNYTVAKESFYDDEKMIWGTYIGHNDAQKTLACTVWGNTEQRSKATAHSLAEILENHSNPKP